MLEPLIAQRNKFLYPTIQYGLDVEGWDGTGVTKNNSVTTRQVNGNTVYDFPTDHINHMAFPSTNTPSIAAEDVDYHVYFVVKAIPAANGKFTIIARYREQTAPVSFRVQMLKSGLLQAVFWLNGTEVIYPTTGTVEYGKDYDLRITRSGATWSMYLNSRLIWAQERDVVSVVTWAWVFGTYINQLGAIVNTGTAQSAAEWTLYGVSLKRT